MNVLMRVRDQLEPLAKVEQSRNSKAVR